jgi:hypothetical protein
MEDGVTHRELHLQITELDKRLIRVETRVESISESERNLSAKVEQIVETLAGLAGEQRATKWLITIGLVLTTAILTAVQVFV